MQSGERAHQPNGFTFIELLVVLSIVALLLSVSYPRYMQSVETAKEAALRENLRVMRGSLDRYKADKGRWPGSLDELVSSSYLSSVPIDPITESSGTWRTEANSDTEDNGVRDVKSGAVGSDREGRSYASY